MCTIKYGTAPNKPNSSRCVGLGLISWSEGGSRHSPRNLVFFHFVTFERGFDIFYRLNPSGCTMSLGSTQSLAEMSTRDLPWGKGGRCVGLTTLPHSCTDCLKILWASISWSPGSLSRPVEKVAFQARYKRRFYRASCKTPMQFQNLSRYCSLIVATLEDSYCYFSYQHKVNLRRI